MVISPVVIPPVRGALAYASRRRLPPDRAWTPCHGSPLPVGFYIERLQPHRPADLRTAVDEYADDGGQAEEPRVECRGVLELTNQDQQHEYLEHVRAEGGQHHQVRADLGGPAHGDDAYAEEQCHD